MDRKFDDPHTSDADRMQ